MKKDYVISFLLHLAVLAIIIIFSATTSKAKLPNPGDFISVGLVSKAPMQMPQAPSGGFSEGGYEEPAPVKLASRKEKEKINKPKPKPKEEPKQEPQPDKGKSKPAPESNNTEVVNDDSEGTGSGVDMSVGDGTSADGDIYNGPLGDYYLAYDFGFVKRRILQNWDNPVKSNSPIACKIYFQIKKDGSVQGVIVKESSGTQLFDKYAELAVKVLKKLPPLPQDFPSNEVLEVNLTFNYRP